MPFPEATSIFALDYPLVKNQIQELEFDNAIVLLTIALDTAPRPIRTASVLNTAQVNHENGRAFTPNSVHEIITKLKALELIGIYDRVERVDPQLELAIIMAVFSKEPKAGSAIAEAMLQTIGYVSLSDPTAQKEGGRLNRSWNFVYDYEAFPQRTRLLLLAGRLMEFNSELSDINRYHEWRVPIRKAEAIAQAIKPFSYFDYDFYRHLATPIRLRAFANAVAGKATWSAQTPSSIREFLEDETLDLSLFTAYDEALLGFGASLSLHQFSLRQNPPEAYLHPRAKIIIDAASGNLEDATQQALVIEDLGAGMAGLADIVAALLRLRQNESELFILAERIKSWREGPLEGALEAFKAYIQWSLGNVDLADQLLTRHFGIVKSNDTLVGVPPEMPKAAPVAWMIALWTYAWTGLKPNPLAVDALLASFSENTFGQPNTIGFQPAVKGEILNALESVMPGDPRAHKWKEEANQIASNYNLSYLLNLQSVPEPWEYALRVIRTVASGGEEKKKDAKSSNRLIWIIDFDQQQLIPREQTRGKRGWSKGRQLAVVDLIEQAGTGKFDADDDRVIGASTRYDGKSVALGRRYGAEVRLEFGRALFHLDGHPRVFLDDTKRVPLDIIRAKPNMHVEEYGQDLRLSFVPAGAHREGYYWEKDTPTRYRIYEISAEQARLARAIGRQTIIPGAKREAIESSIEDLREHVTVNAVMEFDGEELEEVLGDNRPCAQLLPFGVAYKLELYARPLLNEELYMRIGQGQTRSVVVRHETGALVNPENLEALSAKESAGERVILRRDLAAEERAAKAMVEDCPTLRELGHTDFEWTLDDDYAALRVLLELRSLQQEGRITVEHPKGQKLRLVGVSGADSMQVQIRKDRDWFEVSGKVTADEGTVVSFRQLLSHLRNGGGEFVELGEGEFVAITSELRSRLEAMEGLLQERGESIQLPTLAAPAFADLIEELEDVEVDDAWRSNLDRIKATADFDPALPINFTGELRDYQVTGYRWLRRLAEWGVGGCLADDMGLGKTVQALALLVARQAKGPALVIAPASVTRNWILETQKFAPGLTPKLLSTSGDLNLLDDLEAGDVLLVSYGLLTFVEDKLLQIAFSTIVLDEAQAIKNPATKRAKLIFKLEGELRIATTGTPIENHLGELWSLFRFLNPGLLGSRAMFNEKYAGPIRREGNTERAEALRKLVRPFVLRRRKEEVLKELPPKTEVNLSVELSPGEMALYEALRREAVDAIDGANPTAQRMIVLQQLTRLRQAACHPKLVRPNSPLPSAKLELVGQTILELLETGHKALVFSQFVRHLKLVEAWVQAAGIRYCYLDGSTPGGKRQKQVEAFQNGDAELFLISLKAGGTGLNLTAADYVLHLDPWWNPAAEDQASDRAHRIGQQRPVTVYRFVSEGTIEERILALHAEKRDLADQILEGTDAGGKLSVAEVVDLLREG